jgi:hypothetical protein
MATAVCVVDMLNPYDHEVIYVNDNYGDWNSSQEELAERAMRAELMACADCRLEA